MTVGDVVRHLRLPFSILLLPIFLLGAVRAGAVLGVEFILVLVAFHIFLYGGTNAFNSFYDRDTGPIGAMYTVRPFDRQLLWWALTAKVAGGIIVLLAAPRILPLYVFYVVLSIAYSHPKIRWKRHPLASTLVVVVGQGGMIFLTGRMLGHAPWTSIDTLAVAGTMLQVAAIYPFSQIYQHEEDARRGDLTLSLVLGEKGTFRWSEVVSVFGILCLASAVVLWKGLLAAVPLLLFLPVFLPLLNEMKKRFADASMRVRYNGVMRISFGNAIGFIGYILLLRVIW